MRILRVRFTLRRMMVAVALVALYLGTEAGSGRRDYCRKMAERHVELARAGIRNAEEIASGKVAGPVELLDYNKSMIHTHLDTAQVYRRAALWPWVEIPREKEDVCMAVEPPSVPSGGGIPALVLLVAS